ncbi:hypothetical protein E3Z27_15545 [Pseudomonas mediterranea]|uniref:hypothetical protein n=1 Tax=Pseudomonas mediterranea TaxID=183795 RepID=UPI0006D8CE20|nr:hypothetical protein [Pseudomonas mediterranea]MBL0841811.1 hypothetical protein [Pseudomonas mediterranea]MDU9029491.1 hypothetical protein [Pseudomonas mediterranea]QHA82982.1 hypothetical protein E3Z27_15545 [Pseudomonas mediterranea]
MSNTISDKAAWFVSARADTLAILIGGPLISVALLLAIMQGPAFLIGALLFALFLDIPHVLHTHVRLFAEPLEYQRHKKRFWASLLVISAVCVGLYALNALPWLVAIWVYWQPYHVCKQHFGVAALYAKKAGYRHSTQPVRDMVLAGFAAPLMYRITHGGFHFGDYQLFGQALPFANISIPTPALDPYWAWLAYGVFAVVTVKFIVTEWAHRRQGEGMPRFVLVMLAVSLGLYNTAYLLVDDLYALILIGTSIHALQYHLVCTSTVLAGLRRTQAQPTPSGALGVAHDWVRRMGAKPWIWLSTLGLASLLVLSLEMPSVGLVPLIVVLHHFYLDGVIWKRR